MIKNILHDVLNELCIYNYLDSMYYNAANIKIENQKRKHFHNSTKNNIFRSRKSEK